MQTLQQLYTQLLQASLQTSSEEELEWIKKEADNSIALDCLLDPQAYAPIWVDGDCDCESDPACMRNCLFAAIQAKEGGGITIDPSQCVGCSACLEACDDGKLHGSKDLIGMLLAMKEWKGPVYAIVAPAIQGQFGADIEVGQIRAALKTLGFSGMVEAALFADILTLKEALEFDAHVQEPQDFQLTSCCCPMWIAMIKKHFETLIPHVPAAVSPMIAAGRTIKYLYPDALTVFIGPCIAKKAEAREPDLVGDIDFVLTFQELEDLFAFAKVDVASQEQNDKEHSSAAGIGYAYTGGVSQAILNTLEKINPERAATFQSHYVDGVPACKALIESLVDGQAKANFYEGMGCVGGCVGGPKIRISKEAGKAEVEAYQKRALHQTPIENPYVITLCERMGLDSVEALIEQSHIFTREFMKQR
ncbi:MAG: [Fe-Fe] hydrogenase large subunit C-terminal domain-containing protein [Erysipelotrichaceae bacterium]